MKQTKLQSFEIPYLKTVRIASILKVNNKIEIFKYHLKISFEKRTFYEIQK